MKASFYTLGCKVNQYETQVLREQFAKAGYRIAGEDEIADVYVINTCSVTNLSDRKSRQKIRHLRRLNSDAVIVVTGCYAQTAPQEIAEIEGVSVIAGANEKAHIVEFVEEYLENRREQMHVLPYEELDTYIETGSITFMESRVRAFIKIQEGCDRFCAYCIIPYARGKVRSRRIDDIVSEAKGLIEGGCKEIVLTGINTALYGNDLEDSPCGIDNVVDAISRIEGDFRIRLSSLEPNVVDSAMARKLIAFPKLCSHMHLSIQSGSDSVLRRMNRIYNTSEYEEIASVFKKHDPNYGLTTDIIVGFPGETEEEFEETLDASERIGFSKIHIFKYSVRNGTVAADMPDQISGSVKTERSERLSAAADKLARRFFESNAGTVRRVLFEHIDEETGMLTGYTDNYIKTYCRMEDLHIENPEGRFAYIKLERPFKDGMKGIEALKNV